MSSLRRHIQSSIYQLIEQHDGEQTAVDILRIVQEEATLIKETKELQDVFVQDPFELTSSNEMSRRTLDQFGANLRVVECTRQRLGHDNCRIDAIVETQHSNRSGSSNGSSDCDGEDEHCKTDPSSSYPRLIFRYVRQPRKSRSAVASHRQQELDYEQQHHVMDNNDDNDSSKNTATTTVPSSSSSPCHIWYSIELCLGIDQPKHNLLVVEIFAPKSSPTLGVPAVCINDSMNVNDDDDDGSGWEDEDDDEENNVNRTDMDVDDHDLSGQTDDMNTDDDDDNDDDINDAQQDDEANEDGWEDIESDDEDGRNGLEDDQHKSKARTSSSSPSSKRQKRSDSMEEHNVMSDKSHSQVSRPNKESSKKDNCEKFVPGNPINGTGKESLITENGDDIKQYNDKDDHQEGVLAAGPPDSLPMTHDSYIAYLDPDLLHEFVRIHFGSKSNSNSSSSSSSSQTTFPTYINEATAFYLLMMFPFYEHEWDIIGYVLDEVFGPDDDSDDDSDDDDDENNN